MQNVAPGDALATGAASCRWGGVTYLLWPTPTLCLAIRVDGDRLLARWAWPGGGGPWRVVGPWGPPATREP